MPLSSGGRSLGDILDRRCRQAGIERCTPHDLRRTCVSVLLAAGSQGSVAHPLPWAWFSHRFRSWALGSQGPTGCGGLPSDEPLLAAHRDLAATLGEDEKVLAIDGTAMPKDGTESVGVARQSSRPTWGATLRVVTRRGLFPDPDVWRWRNPATDELKCYLCRGPAAMSADRLVWLADRAVLAGRQSALRAGRLRGLAPPRHARHAGPLLRGAGNDADSKNGPA